MIEASLVFTLVFHEHQGPFQGEIFMSFSEISGYTSVGGLGPRSQESRNPEPGNV